MAVLAGQVHAFADLLIAREGNAETLTAWITRTRSAYLPFLHSFAHGLERVTATPSTPPSPCPTTTAALRAPTPRSSSSSG
ncbi:hypothetical protein [Streptomyces tendae]|uniref:hypothetical protein n=1 Tax=Streptomyces tendae TaxID=1932 RepID=UPI0036C7DC23